MIDFGPVVEKYHKQILLDNAQYAFSEFATKECAVALVPSEHELFKVEGGKARYPSPTLLVQNIKVYCSCCKKLETFSPTVSIDASEAVSQRRVKDSRTAAAPRVLPDFFAWVSVRNL